MGVANEKWAVRRSSKQLKVTRFTFGASVSIDAVVTRQDCHYVGAWLV